MRRSNEGFSVSDECIHGFEVGMCASCYPKPVAEADAKPVRVARTREPARPALRSSPNRSAPATAKQKAVDVGELRDPQTLAERTIPGHENILVVMGVCTHLGCVPLGAADGENKGEFGGYFCPCHGSHYDTAARIRKGPAPSNLLVPEYAFSTDTTLVIG